MQESARAAVSYVRSRAEMYDADPNFHEKFDIHIHVPEGRDPQGRSVGRDHDGGFPVLGRDQDPGVEGRRHDRRDHAPGQSPPSRGIKDKVLAAYRAGSGRSSCPPRTTRTSTTCRGDRSEMEFHLVHTMDEVIKIALEAPRAGTAAIEPEPKPTGNVVAN
jgi:ATP-dependent Lon protease